MKKIIVFAMVACMLVSVMLIGASAEATEEITAGPLVITELLNNPSSSDHYEYMELMNIGDTAIDLFDYKVWYTSGTKLESAALPTPGTSKWNIFASAPGENVLEPGEIALVWFIHPDFHIPSESVTLPADVEWFRKDITEAEKGDYTHTLTDYQGKSYAYNVDAFRNMIKSKVESFGISLDEKFDTAKVIICDCELDLITPAEGSKVGIDIHFNLANAKETKAIKYWITDAKIDVIDENTKFYCTAGIQSGNAWAGKCFHFRQEVGTTNMIYDMESQFYSPGYLSESFQPELINLRNSIDPEKYPETAIIVTTEEITEGSTTEEETNPPKTADPNETSTKKPSNTTKNPNTTTAAPQDTTPQKSGGCGGFTVAAQLAAVLMAAFAFVVIKKKA